MTLPHLPFYFIRHGETDWNVSNRIMGHKDIPLNERGIKQAHESLPILKSLKFEKIWASPLLRARQTAQVISESLGVEIECRNFLKERGWGVGEGKSHQGFLPDMLQLKNGEVTQDCGLPEGAETYAEFEKRIVVVFKEILVPDHQIPLIVSHGGVFRVLTNLLAKEMISAKNCDLYVFKPPQNPSKYWHTINLTESEFDQPS
jgi:broad specificity phosphatase PhoE